MIERVYRSDDEEELIIQGSIMIVIMMKAIRIDHTRIDSNSNNNDEDKENRSYKDRLTIKQIKIMSGTTTVPEYAIQKKTK
mmetsp:Transcript_50704/g.56651  ORF Transcript_50704/g.56651 Transcript_50704/m.56651 type:complete len:81 (+) Transcript_50704:251-493(+)